MSAFEEARLGGGAIAGDAHAASTLWQTHRRWVAAILLAHKPKDVELDDLLQDVAMSMVKHIQTLSDPLAVKPWLRAIAINAARTSGRKLSVARRLRPAVEAQARRTAQGRAEPDPSGAPDQSTRAIEVARTLPPEYGEPLLLRAVRGLSYRQIADIMGLPMTTIETRLARARRMLREELDRAEHDPAPDRRPSS